MKLLSLDPSSTVIGYAIFDDRTLVEFGLLTPDKGGMEPLHRVRSLHRQLMDLVIEQAPGIIVIEAMIEMQFTRREGRYNTMPLCGWAMGVIYGACLGYAAGLAVDRPRCTVAAAGNQEWTRGKPKPDRIAATAMQFPQYDASRDPGGDMADAIEMGLWWLTAVERQERVDAL